MSMPSLKTNLLGFDRLDLARFATGCGEPRFRGEQLFRGIYGRREQDLSRCSDFPVRFREHLKSHGSVAYPEIKGQVASRDGSIRYLFSLEDGETIETVFMPDRERVTLCVSSQAGCAVNCHFCFTAMLGLKRNLTSGEIVGQILGVLDTRQLPPRTRLNIVFMGMGEPLLNLPTVMKSVRILSDPDGLVVPLRRITISTSGIVPHIYELAREAARPKLAISLNASTDEQRTALMPVNRKYPLHDLLRACREFPLGPRERLTFEYVLLDGINDTDADAGRVAVLIRGMCAKVNLIPYNSGTELPYRPSPLKRVLAFQKILEERRVPTFIRISRGRDIMAACGQLKLTSAQDLSSHAHAQQPSI